MKRLLYIIILLNLAILTGCGPSKSKMEQQISVMEEHLFNAESGFSRAGADSLIKLYCDFAIEWPNDSLAPAYLFKAATMAMNLQDAQVSLALFDQVRASYPNFEKIPLCLFFTAYVQENVLGDIDQARASYHQFIETYPDHEFADDAQASIDNLGKTPEQLIQEFEARQKVMAEEKK
ncbi:MAG: hypothetical protein D4R67_10530 [Bacteroidetes bacterium]|nr:MAG: hypothetical protein D4R67_10530 [Bacteroidota bacterium]